MSSSSISLSSLDLSFKSSFDSTENIKPGRSKTADLSKNDIEKMLKKSGDIDVKNNVNSHSESEINYVVHKE